MWRVLRAVVVVAAWLSPAVAQEIAGKVETLVFATTDLVFRVDDLGGRVETLQVRQTATETRIELPADILFDFDKADIRSTAAAALKQAADLLRSSARGTVRIEGHTDSKGAADYNMRLSQRRAQSVQRWLTEREGLRSVRFATHGFGATKPVAANAKADGADDPEGRQKNRRVEIVFGRR